MMTHKDPMNTFVSIDWIADRYATRTRGSGDILGKKVDEMDKICNRCIN
jgi:hypothetical protein